MTPPCDRASRTVERGFFSTVPGPHRFPTFCHSSPTTSGSVESSAVGTLERPQLSLTGVHWLGTHQGTFLRVQIDYGAGRIRPPKCPPCLPRQSLPLGDGAVTIGDLPPDNIYVIVPNK